MHPNRKTTLTAAALLTAASALVAGCGSGPSTGAGPSKAGCPAVLAKAEAAVRQAENTDAAWHGPTSGPPAAADKTLVYVAQTMTNPGVAGVAKGVEEAGKAMGWKVRVIDGDGTPAGIQAALSQAITLKPSGIVIGGFDPQLTSQQMARAEAAHIPVIGWHAVGSPGPSEHPRLFTNVTTKVEDVARISADWIIAGSRGDAGVVLFTDDSIPFAKNKSDLIRQELATCSGVRLLARENIPIPDAASRTPRRSPPSSPASRATGPTPSPSTTSTSRTRPRPCARPASRGPDRPSTSARATATRPPSSGSTAGSSRPPPSPSRCPCRAGRSSTSSTAPSPAGPPAATWPPYTSRRPATARAPRPGIRPVTARGTGKSGAGDALPLPPAGYWYGSKGMPAGLASARWEAKESSFRPKCALPKSAWLSLSRRVAG